MKARLFLIAAALVAALALVIVVRRPTWLRALGIAVPATPGAPTSTPRARQGGMDLTFLFAADTHIGFEDLEALNRTAVERMNELEGTAFPPAVGMTVGAPRGVLVAGDLTENGKPEEWTRFIALYGPGGPLRHPLFETIGNHDKHSGWHVKQRVAERHGAVRYAWDWQDLHLVCLGEAPDEDDLAWLATDLAGAGHEVGVILYFHFALLGPYSRGNWFGDGGYPDQLFRAIDGYRVLGIIHGHYHGGGHYGWRGIDVYNPGSVAKHGMRNVGVARVTDTRLAVGSWDWEARSWTWWHEKPVFGADGDAIEGDVRR
jgi:hypothetical protein